MRKYRLSAMAFILCVTLLFTNTVRAYAESVSGNETGDSGESGTVSDNESDSSESGSDSGNGGVSENGSGSTSGNDPGSVSEDQVYEISISCNLAGKTKRTVLISVSAKSKGSGVALIQAENEKAGIRKTIYKRADEGVYRVNPEGEYDDAVDLKFTLTSNGSYIFYAYDGKGNMDSVSFTASDMERRDISYYLELAELNRKESDTGDRSQDEDGDYPLYLGTAFIGGGGTDADSYPAKAYDSRQGYVVRSGDGSGDDTEPSASDKYKDWSMLKSRDKGSDFRSWYEPYALSGDNARPQPLENVLNLSDYETDLFKAEHRAESDGVLGESASPADGGGKSGFPDLKFSRPDDNIGGMNDSNRIIIIGVIVFIIILIMLLAGLLLMRGTKDKKAKKGSKRKGYNGPSRGKAHPKTGSGTSASSKKAGNKSLAKGKTGAKGKAAAKSSSASGAGLSMTGTAAGGMGQNAASKGRLDDGIEKYAKMTIEYARSKLGIELERVSLKKYYSERHGFDCVDFTYRLPKGTATSQFKPHLNDVDTALTNVSGKDTITFPMGNDTGVYKTTFYLNK